MLWFVFLILEMGIQKIHDLDNDHSSHHEWLSCDISNIESTKLYVRKMVEEIVCSLGLNPDTSGLGENPNNEAKMSWTPRLEREGLTCLLTKAILDGDDDDDITNAFNGPAKPNCTSNKTVYSDDFTKE